VGCCAGWSSGAGSGAAAGWAIGAGGKMGAGLAGTKAEAGMTGEPVAADAVRDISVPGAADGLTARGLTAG